MGQNSGHAKLSPSQAERWFNCPGAVNLISTLPESAFTSSPYAAEGTVAHRLAELYVTGKLDLLKLMGMVGTKTDCEGYEIEVTEAMVDGVLEYSGHIATIKARLNKPGTRVVATEAEVAVNDDVWGTVDFIAFQKGHEIHVVDFKYGKGLVLAEENKQGLTYLRAATVSKAGDVFDKAFFHIVQPRVPGGDSIKTWELPPGRLKAFKGELEAAVKRTKEEDAKRCAGPWCRFCPGLGYCPEAGEATQQAAGMVFDAVPTVAAEKKMIPVEALTPAQIATALDWEDVIDSRFEAIRARALAELSADPTAVPGYKLVEKKTNRAWGDEEKVKEAFAILGDTLYAPRKVLSPAQLEKIAGKDEVAPFVVKPQGALTVAKTTDKRQAATPALLARDVFGAVGDDGMKKDLKESPKKGPIWP